MNQRDEIPDPPPLAWLLAVLLGITLLMLQATLDEEPTAAPPAAISALACPGMHPQWVSDSVVECLREQP